MIKNMNNLLLLSGMDGTGILFRPLLTKLEICAFDVHIAIYDFNADDNQQLSHQANNVIKFIHTNFNKELFIVVFESYSSLFVPYLLKHELNIHKSYIIGGFLTCPSVVAKWGKLFHPIWTALMPNKLLGWLLFRHWANDELIGLFREVLVVIGKPDVLPLFKKRLSNIACAKIPHELPKSSIPCVYLSASHDKLVGINAGLVFKALFDDMAFNIASGTHFLLQTNPDCLIDELNKNLSTKWV